MYEEQMSDELKELSKLKVLDIDVVQANGGFLYQGQPAMVMERLEGSNRDLAMEDPDNAGYLSNPKNDKLIKIIKDNKERSLESLENIRSSLIINKKEVSDIQFLITSDGRFVVNDPLKVRDERFGSNMIKAVDGNTVNHTVAEIGELMNYIRGL
ncbi:hypothetical protein MNBD_GAMMA10-1633 [hydrothermal vent metagenome]|uniref:Type III secretion system effector HopBF1-like domain-containing protein n=1 Tax=hydrothermal vent metagenome TaxID=652676 RepID=A0A3B0XT15_9ZZZZ